MHSSQKKNQEASEFDTIKLVAAYLETIIRKSEFGKTVIDPWWTLLKPELTWSVAEKMSELLADRDLDGICVLTESGIPIGAAVAQVLNLPLFFYRRTLWELDDMSGRTHIVPLPEPGTVFALIDSHIVSGFSASVCLEYLAKLGVSVECIAAPISFVPLGSLEYAVDDIEYVTICEPGTHDYLADLFHLAMDATRVNFQQDFPSKIPDYPIDMDREYLSKKFARFWAIIKSFVQSPQTPIFEPYDSQLAESLRAAFDSSDSGIWAFFKTPVLIEQTCLAIGEKVDVRSRDALIGTGEIGTIFAICIAYHLRFSGPVLTTMKNGLLSYESVSSDIQTKAVVTSGRLKTGQYLVGTARILNKLKLGLSDVVVLRYPRETARGPHNRPLKSMKELECDIIILS